MAILSLILISNFKTSDKSDELAFGERVELWGPFPYDEVSDVLEEIEREYDGFEVVEYVEVPVNEFANTFVNAIAEGRSPDLVILPHTELVAQRSKLTPLPYNTDGLSKRDLRNRYIDGTEIFAREDALYAIPLAVDPLVMYWNRDLFSGAGLASAPRTWEEFISSTAGSLTRNNGSRGLIQSAVAFGEYANVRNAAEVLAMLLLQSGSQMVVEENGRYSVLLNDSLQTNGQPPMEAAVQFYTNFNNPSNPLYSWNRAMPEDRLSFISGDLAIYFGFGSEIDDLVRQNPNLNFDISLPPQGAAATVARTYGEFYGLAIPRAAYNQSGAFAVASILANSKYTESLANTLNLSPVRRDILSVGSDNEFTAVVRQAALIARGWLSPTPSAVDNAFASMLTDINSNKGKVSQVVRNAISRLSQAY